MQRLRSNKKSVFFFIVLAIFIVYALSLILPFLWAFMTTFKTEAEYINNKAYFPDIIDWTNYIDAFRTLSTNNTNMFVMLFNSLWWSFGSTILAVAASTMSAYVVAKYKFPGRQVIYGIALFTMMLPIIGALPAQYTVYSALGILDNPAMLISTIGGFGFNFFVLYGFFRSLPWDYVEASFLDGAGHFTTMVRVMLPMALPVMTSLAVVAFIGVWNDYNTPIVFLENYPTLASGLYLYQNATMQHSVDIPLLFAGVLMSIIPVVALFCIFQNSIMNMSFGGGLKG